MLNYFKYLLKLTLKKKSVWISSGVLWLFIAAIVLIVPLILKLSPLTLWNNTLIDIPAFIVIIMAIICSIITVVIFRDSRDDGTEIIILSKPINRWKIIISKFIIFLITIIITICITMIIFLFTLCWGQYSKINPNGLVFSDLVKTEGGFFIGSLLMSLLFGGIAILISTISNKIGIMVCTIGISILIEIFYSVIPMLSSTQNSYLQKNYNTSLDSHRYISLDNQLRYGVNINDINEDMMTKDYIAEANKHITGGFGAYSNIGLQMADIYRIFNTSSINEDYCYGNDSNLRYVFDSNSTNFLASADINKPVNNFPFAYPNIKNDDGLKYVEWQLDGVPINNLSLYSSVGMSIDDVGGISVDSSNVLSLIQETTFINIKDIVVKDESLVNTYITDHLLNQMNSWQPDPQDLSGDNTLPYIDIIEDDKTAWGPKALKRYNEFKNFSSSSSQTYKDPNHDYLNIRRQFGMDILNSDLKINNKTLDEILGYKIIGSDSDKNLAMSLDYLALLFYLDKYFISQMWTIYVEHLSTWNNLKNMGDDNFLDVLQTGIPAIFSTDQNKKDKETYQLLNWYVKNLFYTHFQYFDFSNTDIKKNYETGSNKEVFIYSSGSKLSSNQLNDMFSYDAKPYVTNKGIIIFYTIFSIIMFSLAIVIYSRTDFK